MKLWCEVPGGSGNCKTAEMPAADGTPCADNKVIDDVFFDHSKKFFFFFCKKIGTRALYCYL